MTVEYMVEDDRQSELIDIYQEYMNENELEIFIDGTDPDGEGQTNICND